MYVYYESWKFGTSFYTHRITVHENCNNRLCEILRRKYGNKAVRWSESRNKIYVRETLRIARVHKNKPRNTQTQKYGEWRFATSKNYALHIYTRIDVENGYFQRLRARTFEELLSLWADREGIQKAISV